MRGDRRLMALAMITADVVIVLVLAYVATATSAAIVGFVLGILFIRWWLRSST